MRGDGEAMGMSGLGPAAFPGGLLIMTGGDGGRGVKLQDDQTEDLAGGGVGVGTGGASACCRLGTVA